MVEFTGERVVPGQVNDDLWSEHYARYAFARRLSPGKRVLDAGCGTGYGSAELAQSAHSVVGIDLSPDATAYATSTFPLKNLTFAAASCDTLPFATYTFDLVAAFEVIEHLPNFRLFIAEAARVLTANGLFIVSTPNKRYYTETRAQTGPNPYHEHEFEAEEFHRELSQVFPHVALLLQNRVESFAFHPIKTFWPSDSRIDGGGGSADDAHFFVAICSRSPLPELHSFCYVPRAANILREREQHVQKLDLQLDQTKQWLASVQKERDDLLTLFRAQKDELEAHNRWAAQLSQQLEESHSRIDGLQTELAQEQSAAIQVAQGYEAKVRQLEDDNLAKTQWAQETETRLTAEIQTKTDELTECVHLLDQAEDTVRERTLWAQRADAERAQLAAQVNAASASKWLKLGRLIGLGPRF